MTESASSASPTPSKRLEPTRAGRRLLTERLRSPFGFLSAVWTVLGGLASGLALTVFLSWSATPDVFTIERTAPIDIDAASQSLFGSSVVANVAAAKSCRRPLASIIVSPLGETFGILQFRSGDYESPKIRVGRNPFRLALPFPAPVTAGAGQIYVTSDVGGAALFMRPGVTIPLGMHEKTINVVWDPKAPCSPTK